MGPLCDRHLLERAPAIGQAAPEKHARGIRAHEPAVHLQASPVGISSVPPAAFVAVDAEPRPFVRRVGGETEHAVLPPPPEPERPGAAQLKPKARTPTADDQLPAPRPGTQPSCDARIHAHGDRGRPDDLLSSRHHALLHGCRRQVLPELRRARAGAVGRPRAPAAEHVCRPRKSPLSRKHDRRGSPRRPRAGGAERVSRGLLSPYLWFWALDGQTCSRLAELGAVLHEVLCKPGW